MPLSEDTKTRAMDAVTALKNVCVEYRDVIVVLDFVTLNDIANLETDSDDANCKVGELPEEDLRAILWHLGKHVGGTQCSHDLLPALAQFALDEHERKQSG